MGTGIMLVAIFVLLVSLPPAQGGRAEDLAQANFTVTYNSFFGGINPSTTTISYNSQNNTMISNTTQLFDRFQPAIKMWGLTEQEEQELRTMIIPIISNRYDFNDNTCPSPSACNGFEILVTIGNQTNEVSWSPYSSNIINQMDFIANQIVSSNSTKGQ